MRGPVALLSVSWTGAGRDVALKVNRATPGRTPAGCDAELLPDPVEDPTVVR